jgi:hypothetical protein
MRVGVGRRDRGAEGKDEVAIEEVCRRGRSVRSAKLHTQNFFLFINNY